MPAVIYAPPEEIGAVPGWGDSDNIKEILDAEADYIERLVEWCRETGTGDLRGEKWRYQVGDGYAVYVIWKLRPLSLIHIPTGDSWGIPEVVRRGLSASLVREDVERSRKIAEFFAR